MIGSMFYRNYYLLVPSAALGPIVHPFLPVVRQEFVEDVMMCVEDPGDTPRGEKILLLLIVRCPGENGMV